MAARFCASLGVPSSQVAAAVPTDNGANGVSEAAHEAPKAALKKVANAAPNNKCVSEGIDEDAYEALKSAHARPQYRTENVD
ncbi:hypothetical protein M885DRAFT_626670 [Pelagophyceae sp. CCMP2097]|nr:hypothetical protein M885DRAFT_626670 [Pelagophyceae sp. CCMP2097]